MKLHRFYIPTQTELKKDFWLHDEKLLHQLTKVLRYRVGQDIVLFDGFAHDSLYKIAAISDKEVHVVFVTEFVRKIPKNDIYLLWSLLKKDKNDWVLQKCTELGVSHFIPIIAERSEKTGFNLDRAQKIVIEASEQCARSDIPSIRQPILVATALVELKNRINLYVAEQSENQDAHIIDIDEKLSNSLGIFIGPEGGWSDSEKVMFNENALNYLNLHDFTLRAETAAVTAITKLLQ